MADEKSLESVVQETALQAQIKKDFQGGATIGLELEGKDGILTRTTAVNGSLLRQILTVDMNHYENEIKTGNYSSPKEARLFAAALWEAETLGMDTKLIKYIHMANNAGINHGLIQNIIDGLTHSEFTFRNGKTNDSKRGKSSPLS
jgi:hypothetical protein